MFHSAICENSMNCEKCLRGESRRRTIKKVARYSAMPILVGTAAMIPAATLAYIANRNVETDTNSN